MQTTDITLNQEAEQLLREGGAVLVGFGDLTVLPAEQRLSLPVGIAFAMPLDPEIVATLFTGPSAEYAAEYDRLNVALTALGERLADFLRERGYQAENQGATLHTLNLETLATRLPHKTVATRAGLGWIGKCALLVNETYGSAIRICSVLTDAPLATNAPITTSRCGGCTACRTACPAEAPRGILWEAGMPREEIFDAHACARAAKTQCQAAGIPDYYICGRCIVACPWTQGYMVNG